MKKRLCLLLCLLFLLGGCNEKEIDDSLRFKEEYEALNNQKVNDMLYSSITINETNTVRYVESDELLAGLENGTHVVYMGYPDCPWCRRAIPVLIDTVNQYNGVSIYYYNLKTARSDYQNGIDSDEAELYRAVIAILQDNEETVGRCVDYFEDGSIKTPASLILFIKGGEIIGAHRRTVESHIDPYEPLTAEQISQLEEIYSSYLGMMADYNPVYCSGC